MLSEGDTYVYAIGHVHSERTRPLLPDVAGRCKEHSVYLLEARGLTEGRTEAATRLVSTTERRIED